MENLILEVEKGFNSLEIESKYKKSALENIKLWLTDEQFSQYKSQIIDLIKQKKWDFLLDSFYQIIPFGTGGRRGPVGIGPNRINPYTIATSVQGHVEYLKKRYNKDSFAVVIAYDVRIFNDLRGIYNKNLPNPVLGISSKDLAYIAAQTYAANGVIAFIPQNSYISTPELSFFIRELNTDGGLNISASHNHPDDNGGKFYDNRGGQAIPPEDEVMANLVNEILQVKSIDYEEGVKKGLIKFIPPNLQKEYIDTIMGVSLRKDARKAKVVFTPLHGTGTFTAGKILKDAGFEIINVEEQCSLDGNFPNVKYRIPNPEVPESMNLAVEKAKEVNADIVISTDPDADRIGVVIPDNDNNWLFLTGNEIATIITHYILNTRKEKGKLPQNPILVKTEVTTELIQTIGNQFAAKTIGHLLVGFKYIADVIYQIQTKGEFNGIKGSIEDFIIGVEESHGILLTPKIRDKDAAGAALILAEMTAYLKSKGKLLYDYLNDIYKEYGYYKTLLIPTVMQGAVGMERMNIIQEQLRKNPPKEIADIEVEEIIDHWDEKGIFGPIKSKTDKSGRNFLIFKLKNGAKLIIRPSGTEPKNKIYIEMKSEPLGLEAKDEDLANVKQEIDKLVMKIGDDFTAKMLNIIGIKLPDYAFRISGLVSLDNKIDFVENFLPEFEDETKLVLLGKKTTKEVRDWLNERLSRYGKDPKGLVRDALRRYIDGSIEVLRKQKEIFFE
jgi:phosphoglucomutase/phosphomannomutase